MSDNQYIKNLSQIDKQAILSCGGKGSVLGELMKAGVAVPQGFVVQVNAFDQFLKDSSLTQLIKKELGRVNIDDTLSVKKTSDKIRENIVASEIYADIINQVQSAFNVLGAEYVAIRSSATAEDSVASSWAGELDIFLNTTKDSLLDNLKKCWASLYSSRAIIYRFEKGFSNTEVKLAVVVQKMINGQVSGVAFSVHPVTENVNHIIIEAGWGLGEAVVSGEITPDSYVVDKRDWSLVDINVNFQEKELLQIVGGGSEWKSIDEPRTSSQKLSKDQIVELSKLIVSIEKHFEYPIDIEWTINESKVYILQSRPITTLE